WRTSCARSASPSRPARSTSDADRSQRLTYRAGDSRPGHAIRRRLACWRHLLHRATRPTAPSLHELLWATSDSNGLTPVTNHQRVLSSCLRCADCPPSISGTHATKFGNERVVDLRFLRLLTVVNEGGSRVHGGLKIYRGSPVAARSYVESDRSRADDYYLAE